MVFIFLSSSCHQNTTDMFQYIPNIDDKIISISSLGSSESNCSTKICIYQKSIKCLSLTPKIYLVPGKTVNHIQA